MSVTVRVSRSVRPLCAALLLTSGLLPARAAEKVPADRRLPPDVYLYANVPDVTALKQRFGESRLGGLLEDRAFADIREEAARKIAGWSKEVQKELGVRLEDLWTVPHGEAAIAVLRTGGGRKPAVVGLLDYGPGRETVDKLIDRFVESVRDQEPKRSVREVDDVRIVAYEFRPKDEDEKETSTETVAWFLKDGYFVLSNETEALEQVLARWDGRHPATFADRPVHRRIAERTRGDRDDAAPVLTWYADPVGLFEAQVASRPADLQGALVLGWLPQLGLKSLRGIGGSYAVATRDYEGVFRIAFDVEQPAPGVFQALRFPAKELRPPRWVPDDATLYLGLNWDLAGGYEAVERLVDAFQGPGTFKTFVDAVAKHEGGPALHPKEDLIDLLDGSVHVVAFRAPKPAADDAEPPEAPVVFGLGLKDPAKMKGVLEKLGRTEGAPVKSREFRGTVLWEIKEGDDVAGAYGVAGSTLMFASDVKRLEDAVRGETPRPLAERDDFRALLAKAPARVSMLVFQDPRAELETTWDLLRKTEPTEDDDVDFRKLPPFDAVRKYLDPQLTYGVPDDDGCVIVGFGLRRREQ